MKEDIREGGLQRKTKEFKVLWDGEVPRRGESRRWHARLRQQKGSKLFWVHWSRNDMPVVFSSPDVRGFMNWFREYTSKRRECVLCPLSLPAFVQLNPEHVGLGLLFSMCIPSTSHPMILHKVLVREITACVKGEMVWEWLRHSYRGSSDVQWGCNNMHQLFHCLPFEKERKKAPAQTHDAQTCYFSPLGNKRSFQLVWFVSETINLRFIKANTWVISSIQEEY